MQKPWLGNPRCKVYAYRLDDDLANDVSLGLGIPVLGRETRFEDNIDRSADVHFIYLPVNRHADMLLLSMKQHGERCGTRSSVGRTKFPRRNAVVCGMLREEGGEIMVDERVEIDCTCSRLESAED